MHSNIIDQKKLRINIFAFFICKRVRKGFKCYCGKSYKTSQGLKNHSMLSHNNASTETLASAANSPSTSSPSSSLSQSRSISPSSASGGSTTNNNNNNNQNQVSPNATQNTFGLITLKTNGNISLPGVANIVSPTLMATTAKNTNKLMKMFPDTRYDNNNIKTSPGKLVANSSATNGITDNNGSVKISLPSLVNLGILTPATSPKQQQIQPNNAQATTSPTQTLNSGGAGGGGSDNNNTSTLPLTPISPSSSKSVNFAANGNGSNNNDSVTTISDSNLNTEDT